MSEYNITELPVQAQGFTFHCRTAGLNNTGDWVIMLHGFPETSITWEPLMLALAQKGYRCLAPDQRGYSDGARPEGIENYSKYKLMTDITAVADAMGIQKFHLIGHDWGGSVGWMVVLNYPERILSWTSMSSGHPAEHMKTVLTYPPQKRMSQYMFDFLDPDYAQKMIDDDMALYRSFLRPMLPRTLDYYCAKFSDWATMNAAINWYRASLEQLLNKTEFAGDAPVAAGDCYTPTQLMYGEWDPYTLEEIMKRTAARIKGDFVYTRLRAGHWLIEEKEQEVIEHISSFIDNYKVN